MPPSKDVLAAAEPVITAIGKCSVSRAIWHLDAAERWRMVRDTLLGHPQVRGDLRPRDLPIDFELREMLAGIAQFQARGPRVEQPSHQYLFGDWLYAFAVLVELQPPTTAAGLPLAHQAVYECFREIRRVLPWEEGHNPDNGEFSKTCPILHRLIAAVGWSIKDWNSIHRSHKTLPLHETVATARLAARAAWQRGEIEKPKGKDGRRYEELEKRNLRLLTVMNEHVQAYIARGQKHWLMRGASAWCSQVLAFVRDEIPNIVPGSLLLSDSDVVVTFVIPASVETNAETVIDNLWSGWRDGGRFLRRFPRLAEVPAVRSVLDSPESLDVRSVFPDISIQIGEPASLLDLCRPRSADSKESPPPPRDTATRGRNNIDVRAPGDPCLHVTEDVAISSDPPSWLEVRGDNNRGAVSEAFGLTSLVWSLCGTTLKAHWFQNAAVEVSNMVPGMRMMPVHHSEWLKWLGSNTQPLAFLKLDGDGVGAIFTATPIPHRPYLSMELNRLILERVMSGTRAVVTQHVALTNSRTERMSQAERTRASREGVPVHGQDIPMAADMVYIGGDDVFFCLPQESVATFLAGFSAPVAGSVPREWCNLSFKYACVTLPSGVDIDAKSERMQQANLLASQLAGDKLKKVLKDGDAGVFEAIQAESRDKYGFDCELWKPDLVAHSGALDGRIVHGIHVRLRPI